MLPILSLLLATAYQQVGAAVLPTFSVIITQEKGTNVKFDFDGCVVDFTALGDIYTLKPADIGCKGKVSLAALMDHFFPDNKLAEKTNSFLLPDKFDIKNLVVDKSKGTVEFSATAHEKFYIIPDRLSLKETELSLVFNYVTGMISWPKMKVKIDGKATIGGKEIDIKIKKQEDQTHVYFSFSMDKLSLPSFSKLFTHKNLDKKEMEVNERNYTTASVSKLIDDLKKEPSVFLNTESEDIYKGDEQTSKRIYVNVPNDITGMEIKNPKIYGRFDPAGKYEFIISGRPISDIFQGLFYGIVKKTQDHPVSVGLVAVLDNFSPMRLLKKLTGKTDLDIPIFKDITLKFMLQVGSSKIGGIQNKELKAALDEYKGIIPKGLFVQVNLPLKTLLKKVDASIETDDVPEYLFVSVRVFNKMVVFNFPDTWTSDLKKVLALLASNARKIVPQWFSGNENDESDSLRKRGISGLAENAGTWIKVKRLVYKLEKKMLDVYLVADGPIKFGSFFSIENVHLKLTHLGPNEPWNFSFQSRQTIGESATFSTSLKKEGNKYNFEGSIGLLTTKQLMEWLGTRFADPELFERYSFLNFGVQDFKISAEFSETLTYLRIRGKCILFDWDGVLLEGIFFKKGQELKLVLGMRLTGIRLDEIVSKILGKSLRSVTWLTNMNVGMLISNTDDKDMHFLEDDLKDMKIQQGFRFRAVVTPPENCKGDAICLQAKEIMSQQNKKREFVLVGAFDKQGIELRASYEGNWNIGKNVVIQSTSLVIKVGQITSIGFEIQLTVLNPRLEFTGSMSLSSTLSLSLDIRMDSMWKRPFGFNYLEMGNLHLSINYQPGAPWPGGEFGGIMIFGKVGSPDAIHITIYFGIDPVIPMKNYFYGSVKKFTVQSVLSAFEYNPSIPQVLRDTGFPEGVTVSFTANPSGKRLEQITIDNGLALKGTINVLGVEAACQIKVNYPDTVVLGAKMSPVSFAKGAISLQKSQSSASEGPMFSAALTKEKTKVEIAGYVSLLGIESETTISIDDAGYRFYVYGSLFKVLTANVSVEAKYESKDTASFQISSCLTASIPDVQKEIESTINDTKKEATDAIDKATAKAKEADELNEEAHDAVDLLDAAVKKHNEKLRQKIEKYRAENNQMKVNCLLKSQTAYIGGADWKENCIRLENGQYLGCPIWNDKKYKILDEEEYARCKGHNALKMWWAKLKQNKIRAKFAALRVLKRALKVCKKIYRATVAATYKVKKLVKRVHEIFSPVIEFIKKAAKFVLEEIVTIKKLCFSSSLASANADSCLNFDISAILFKTKPVEIHTKSCMDVGFLKQIVNATLEHVSSGVNWVKGSANRLRGLFVEVDTENDKAKEDIKNIKKEANEEAALDDDEDNGDDDIEPSRRMLNETSNDDEWPPEERYFAKYAYEMLPQLTKFESKYFQLKATKSSSVLAASDDVMFKAFKQLKYANVAYNKKVNIESQNACSQMGNVVNGLNDLFSKVRTLAKTFKEEKEAFKTYKGKKEARLSKLETNFRTKCFYIGCNKDQLQDILDYVKIAKEEHQKWSALVDDQLRRQDKETVGIWRNNLGTVIKQLYGSETGNYLNQLRNLGKEAAKKMKIETPDQEGDGRIDALVNALHDILVGPSSMSITDAESRLSESESSSNAALNMPKACNEVNETE